MNRKNSHACRLAGYTLVEIMVVVSSISLIMVATIGIILGSFRAQNRTESNNKVMENGSWILNELKRDIFNSYADSIICADDGLSVEIKSLNDGQTTTLSCDQTANKIASASATKESILNNNEVTITDCSNFVSCEVNGDKITGVLFNFGIGAMTNGVGTSQVFSTRVTLRN